MLKEIASKWMDLDEEINEYAWFNKYECSDCKNSFNSLILTKSKMKVDGCKLCSKEIITAIEYAKEVIVMKKHVKNRINRIYSSMKGRCYNVKSESYKYYGGRGIKVCDEWLNDRNVFVIWANENGYLKHLSIDRIDNDGIYEPSNCRWTTQTIQSRNTRLLSSKNTSGFRGVSFHKQSSSWLARVHADGASVHIGNYSTAFEAAQARDKYVTDNKLEHTLNFK